MSLIIPTIMNGIRSSSSIRIQAPSYSKRQFSYYDNDSYKDGYYDKDKYWNY